MSKRALRRDAEPLPPSSPTICRAPPQEGEVGAEEVGERRGQKEVTLGADIDAPTRWVAREGRWGSGGGRMRLSGLGWVEAGLLRSSGVPARLEGAGLQGLSGRFGARRSARALPRSCDALCPPNRAHPPPNLSPTQQG